MAEAEVTKRALAVAQQPLVGWLRRRVAHLSTTAALAVLLNAAVLTSGQSLASRLVSLLLVTFLPGTLILAAARIRLAGTFERVALAAGAGLAFVMGWAGISSAVLPAVGVSRPLQLVPLLIAVDAVVVLGAVLCPRSQDPMLDVLPDLLPSRLVAGAAPLLLPLAGAAGAELLNAGRGSLVLQLSIAATAVLLLGGLMQAERWSVGRLQVLVFAVTLCLAYMTSLRGNHLFGFDIQQEFQRFTYVSDAARWRPPTDGDPYAAMLSITALPTALARLTGLSGLLIFKAVFPVLLSVVPGLIIGFVARWLSPRWSLVSAVFVLTIPEFTNQLPAISRQEVGLFYFALLLILLADTEVDRTRRQAAILFALAALVVSHYSTSYLAVGLLMVTWFVFGLIRLSGANWRPWRTARAQINLLTAAGGAAMILIWDVAITNSSSNLTTFASNLLDRGPNFLPNDKGSVLDRYLIGTITPAQTPTQYYAAVRQQSITSQPWLRPYPSALTHRFPAQSPPTPSDHPAGAHLPLVRSAFHVLQAVIDETFLVLIATGAVLAVVLIIHDRLARGSCRRSTRQLPGEFAVLSLVSLVVVIFVRLSGTVAGEYNQDRAEIQAGMILAVALAYSLSLVARRINRLAIAAAGVAAVVLVLTATGLASQLSGGTSYVLANTGGNYDQFYIPDQDAAAAEWLANQVGNSSLIWTDSYGELRIWDATQHFAATQTDLTPATIDRGAWVYETFYNVEGRAYGGAASYRFPEPFLHKVKNLVYSSPSARVYH